MVHRLQRFVLAAAVAAGSVANAGETPVGPKWWPSEWGEDDERGAVQRITPEIVLAASRLIKRGEVYALGRVYEPEMPLFGHRHFSLTIPGGPTGGPFGKNRIVYNDEIVSGEIGQVGTQFDGLGHVGTRVGREDRYYNGFRASEVVTPYGLEKLGVEKAGVFFTRGVLVDVAGAKGVPRLPSGYVITVEDVENALERENVEIGEGDVVLFRTGHGTLWKVDNQAYGEGEPGIGIEVARWLAERKIVMTGADSWAVEAVPGADPNRAFVVHQYLLNQKGIYNLENLDLEKLAEDAVWEFAFVFAPLRLKGGTGSPGNPIAVR